MDLPSQGPGACSGGVRTPGVVVCPQCSRPLARKQTVCSPRCRAARWRKRRARAQAERDRRICALLREALRLLDGSSVNSPVC